jgi:hypothetical protein
MATYKTASKKKPDNKVPVDKRMMEDEKKHTMGAKKKGKK